MAKQTTVTPGDNTLSTAIGKAAAGDTLVLTTGEYAVSSEIPVTIALTFIAAEDEKPVLKLSSKGKNFNFKAPFEMNGLEIYSVTNGYVVRAGNDDASPMVLKNCYIHGGGGSLIYGSNYKIGKVEIDNCVFDSCSRGEGAVFQSTSGPIGEFIFTNSTVSNMFGSYAIMVPEVGKALVDHCTFYNVGKDPIYIGEIGITDTCIVKNCIIDSISAGTATTTYKGSVSYCMYNRAADPFENEGAVAVISCFDVDPLFVDPAKGDFNLQIGSFAICAAEDGTNLGDPRWTVYDPTSIVSAKAAQNSKKIMRNGQLIIERNGIYYNAQGQVVK